MEEVLIKLNDDLILEISGIYSPAEVEVNLAESFEIKKVDIKKGTALQLIEWVEEYFFNLAKRENKAEIDKKSVIFHSIMPTLEELCIEKLS